ncbi:glycosyltransferase family 39 protein [Actinosynnema sp. NPDC020468]|uniref:ArnT family glycosyltransferase n=1 Tax=Actinosynnema sp. NPDC020468 TaxID=3154488 RepID=UPI003408A062
MTTRHPWLLPALVGLLAFLFRAVGLTSANDLFVDELTYARLASAVAGGHLPNLSGQPFFLHPPGAFLLDGLLIDVFGLDGPTVDLVDRLRWGHAVLGVAVVVLGYLLARRATTPVIAAVVGVVLATDPFVLRNDSRVMLETPTTAALLAGWLVLLTGTSRLRAVAAGLLFGGAILTKDIAAVLVVLPLLLATVWRRTLAPRRVLITVAAAAVPYGVYLVTLLATGDLAAWWAAKSLGLRRMIGLVQLTGFNAPETPGLGGRLVDQATHFGTSYVLIGLCVVAGVLASLSAHRVRRMLGLIATTSGAFGVYAAAAGTLEEQFGYYVLVPSTLALGVLAVENAERGLVNRRLVTGVVATFTALTAVLGVAARATTDDSYRRAYDWLTANVPAGTPVGLTNVTAEFAFLPRPGYGVWPSLRSLSDHDAHYVLTQSRSLAAGYGYAAPELLTWLEHNASTAFAVDGPSGGRTTVWRLDPGTLRHAVAGGLSTPPVTGPHH